MKTLQINWLAVLVCVILGQVIPFAWYTIFNDAWMNLSGVTMEQANSSDTTPYIVSMMVSLIQVFVMASLFKRMKVESWQDGAIIGLAIGGGIAATEIITQTLFLMKPLGLGLINGGHVAVAFVAIGALLGAWRKYSE